MFHHVAVNPLNPGLLVGERWRAIAVPGNVVKREVRDARPMQGKRMNLEFNVAFDGDRLSPLFPVGAKAQLAVVHARLDPGTGMHCQPEETVGALADPRDNSGFIQTGILDPRRDRIGVTAQQILRLAVEAAENTDIEIAVDGKTYILNATGRQGPDGDLYRFVLAPGERAGDLPVHRRCCRYKVVRDQADIVVLKHGCAALYLRLRPWPSGNTGNKQKGQEVYSENQGRHRGASFHQYHLFLILSYVTTFHPR